MFLLSPKTAEPVTYRFYHEPDYEFVIGGEVNPLQVNSGDVIMWSFPAPTVIIDYCDSMEETVATDQNVTSPYTIRIVDGADRIVAYPIVS